VALGGEGLVGLSGRNDDCFNAEGPVGGLKDRASAESEEEGRVFRGGGDVEGTIDVEVAATAGCADTGGKDAIGGTGLGLSFFPTFAFTFGLTAGRNDLSLIAFRTSSTNGLARAVSLYSEYYGA